MKHYILSNATTRSVRRISTCTRQYSNSKDNKHNNRTARTDRRFCLAAARNRQKRNKTLASCKWYEHVTPWRHDASWPCPVVLSRGNRRWYWRSYTVKRDSNTIIQLCNSAATLTSASRIRSKSRGGFTRTWVRALGPPSVISAATRPPSFYPCTQTGIGNTDFCRNLENRF